MVLDLLDGAKVFAQGDAADAVYAIVGGEGQVRIGSINRRSKRVMVEVLQRGDLFGEIAVIDGGTRTADATADGSVRLARIDGPTFLSVLADTPLQGINLCRMLARRIRRTYSLFLDAAFEPLEVRLARQLLYLASLSGQPIEETARLQGRLREADLANLLGATPRSIITILNAWRSRGLLTYDTAIGQLTIRPKRIRQELISAVDAV
jgi:CRP-like cAMP-binding protein